MVRRDLKLKEVKDEMTAGTLTSTLCRYLSCVCTKTKMSRLSVVVHLLALYLLWNLHACFSTSLLRERTTNWTKSIESEVGEGFSLLGDASKDVAKTCEFSERVENQYIITICIILSNREFSKRFQRHRSRCEAIHVSIAALGGPTSCRNRSERNGETAYARH